MWDDNITPKPIMSDVSTEVSDQDVWDRLRNHEWREDPFTKNESDEEILSDLRYALRHHMEDEWNEDTCAYAAGKGHINCLRFLHENGVPWDDFTCNYAAERGHLECLRYAHENGCPWDEDTCSSAAGNGHLACISYAHENGCPWDELTTSFATSGGHLKCLQYALERDCPIDLTRDQVHATVLPYIYHRGIAFPRSATKMVRNHIRKHVSRARTLVRCVGILLGSYRRACERVYAVHGVGYRDAESSFQKTMIMIGTKN